MRKMNSINLNSNRIFLENLYELGYFDDSEDSKNYFIFHFLEKSIEFLANLSNK